MRRESIKNLILFLVCIYTINSNAQYTFFNPKGAFAIEVSLDNTSLTRLPLNRNSIASLEVLGDYIVGGTKADSGLSPFVFVASIKQKKLLSFKDLEAIVPGQRSIATGFSPGKKGVLYAGTQPNDKDFAAGGHLLEISISKSGELFIRDLGIPIPGEGVFSLICNTNGTELHGIANPSGQFFKYDIISKKTTLYQDIVPQKNEFTKFKEFTIYPEMYLGKALTQDKNGTIYGSMPINKIFAFYPKTEKFEILNDSIPDVWGRNVLGQIESWTVSPEGKLYGGNAGDGQLFELDPSTKQVKNLGKPIMMNRLRALDFAKDGKIYGIAGALPGYAHLFTYDRNQKGFKDLGNPEFTMTAPGIEQGIKWRGFQIGSLAVSEDGKYVVMGEDESLSQLLVFPVND